MVEAGSDILIGEDELVFKFSRSGGPGGQNVNKVNTRVTVLFDVARSASLTDEQKKRILRRLAGRVSKEGILRVACQKYRTQGANRAAAVGRLGELLSRAVESRRVRKKTKVPRSERRRRLEEKKRRSILKQRRSECDFEF